MVSLTVTSGTVLRDELDVVAWEGVDSDCPNGTKTIVGSVSGILIAYLVSDDDYVLGRVESRRGVPVAFVGGGVTGGRAIASGGTLHELFLQVAEA